VKLAHDRSQNKQTVCPPSITKISRKGEKIQKLLTTPELAKLLFFPKKVTPLKCDISYDSMKKKNVIPPRGVVRVIIQSYAEG
jgi:hypothetical protein